MKLMCLVFLLQAATSLLIGSAVAEPLSSAESFHFTYDILPILAKSGCSAAECHGGATGRGGFKLSLFGSNPRSDYETITQELDARRVDYLTPANSLILKKPSRQIRHGGGRRLHQDDQGFKDLLRWIESGIPYIEGLPKELIDLTLKPKAEGFAAQDGIMPYSVIATFQMPSGRQKHDVTRLVMLSSTNDLVATVDKHGNVTQQGPGEAWILARYGNLSARTSIKQAFSRAEPSSLDSSPTREEETTQTDPSYLPHPLDAVWLKRIRTLGLVSIAPASDAVLVRRLYLDLAGRPPSPYEVQRFLEMPEKNRVAVVVDELLKSKEFSKVFALHLGEWFEVPPPGKDGRNDRKINRALRQFFHESIEAEDSMSDIVRKILNEETPKLAWKRFSDPRDRAEFVGRSMLGLSIGCARCHNHPLDRWKRTEHLQFSAYFTDPRPAPDEGMMAGKFFQPENGKLINPVLLPLGLRTSESDTPLYTREEKLTRFVLENAADQFARNIANRIFGSLIGKYLVNPPTDHRPSNPAIHEPILDLLTQTFQAGGTDLRELVRFIVTSRLYALSSDPAGEGSLSGDPALQYLARREARPLSAAQFKTAVESVLGVEIKQPPPPESPLSRQLYVMNSGLIQAGLDHPGNQVNAIFDFEMDAGKQLEDLYMLILSRSPRSEEKSAFVSFLAKAEETRRAGKDLAFALLASREFGSLR